ncbi:aldo/keto reductase [Persicirhabdus sediminis]|uniref:Aldo/keto reductase n=1 Tax=Persicirhabdus sediminis TaxID=454144 RepID=A0A8J7MK53_9BACT|nr:aldo/keto reductase [Persicirhabdus sediminis]MBK1792493.1 aldo/keto reductase [Persicirhabdus sediminis]
MKTRKLGPLDIDVPILSFGASSLGGVFKDVDHDRNVRTVHTAIDYGLNLIDVSPYYGLTKAETELGAGLKGIDRDKYLLSTKCGRYGADEFDFSAERVTKSVDESLGRLGCGHIDFLFCHDIEFVSLEQIWKETLPALHALKESGKVRHVGISGLPLEIFAKGMRECPELIDCVLSYCRYSLNDTSLETLLPEFEKNKVAVINAAPTSMGILTNQGPPEWHPAPKEVHDACHKAAEFCRNNGGDLAALGLQFSTAHEGIPTTLVSTANPDRIISNCEILEQDMDLELLKGVQEILAPIQNQTWLSGLPENNDK